MRQCKGLLLILVGLSLCQAFNFMDYFHGFFHQRPTYNVLPEYYRHLGISQHQLPYTRDHCATNYDCPGRQMCQYSNAFHCNICQRQTSIYPWYGVGIYRYQLPQVATQDQCRTNYDCPGRQICQYSIDFNSYTCQYERLIYPSYGRGYAVATFYDDADLNEVSGSGDYNYNEYDINI